MTTVASARHPAVGPRTSEPVMLWRQTRHELVALRRTPITLILSIGLPLLFFVLLSALIGNEVVDERQGVRVVQFLAPGMAAFGVVMATFSFLAIGLAEARSTGVVKRQSGAPVPRWVLIGGRMGAALLLGLTSTALVLAAGVAFYDLQVPSRSVLAIADHARAGLGLLQRARPGPRHGPADDAADGRGEQRHRHPARLHLRHVHDDRADAGLAGDDRLAVPAQAPDRGVRRRPQPLPLGVRLRARPPRGHRPLGPGRRASSRPCSCAGTATATPPAPSDGATEPGARPPAARRHRRRAGRRRPVVGGPASRSRSRHAQSVLWRNPSAVFFAVAFPVLLVAIIPAVNGGGDQLMDSGQTLGVFYAGTMAIYGAAVTAYVNMPQGVAEARDRGVLKRTGGTPLPAGALVVGRVVGALVVALLTGVAIVVARGAGLPARRVPPGLPAAAVVLVVAAVCFAVVGLAVMTFVHSAQALTGVTLGTLLPLAFISDIFVIGASFPPVLEAVSWVFPLRHASAAMSEALAPGLSGTGLAAGPPGGARWPWTARRGPRAGPALRVGVRADRSVPQQDLAGPLTTYNHLVVGCRVTETSEDRADALFSRALRPHPARHPAPRPGRGALGHRPWRRATT